ncbi:MAG TPA: redoxin domain-containing protein [Pirellulaceae bacterium]|nr:redoxin domain-containing protein [Pirellulaceae bacterium]
MKLFFLMLTAVMLLASIASAAEPLKVGDEAPDFTMVGSDGKTYKLSDFKGKQAVVVAWFPRAFTGGCTKECTSFKNDGAKMREYEVAYFTASNDPAEQNKKFAESLSVDYPILSDPDSSVATKYGVYNPDRKAALRWTFYIGADGKVLFIDKAVKTDAHGADVATKLGELGVAKKK